VPPRELRALYYFYWLHSLIINLIPIAVYLGAYSAVQWPILKQAGANKLNKHIHRRTEDKTIKLVMIIILV
jgi:hypothetical protein